MTAPLDLVRGALAGTEAWLVGGAVRDALLARPLTDLDVVVPGDPRAAARAVGRAVGGPAFALSDAFGAWRVLAPDRSWQVDVAQIQGASIAEDLARRDLTVNAIAEPLAGGPPLDPHDGRGDLTARRLRMVAPQAFDEDPLRTLRVARLAAELGFAVDAATLAAARGRAPRITQVAAERTFAELKRLITADGVLDGLALLDTLGLTPYVLPELGDLRDVEQNRYHHLDVHGHTLEVLAEQIGIERDPGAHLGAGLAAPLHEHLAEPFADGLTRAGALRLGAVLHDVAKPQTQAFHEDGSVLGFPGHADLGADMARAALTRLKASEKLRAHVAALARHHLALGYLVHAMPLDRRAIHRYLMQTAPVSVDVGLLSVADRLATRGRKADEAIAKHLEVARLVLPAALDAERTPPPAPLVRGDVLARELGIAPGPQLAPLLAEIAEARYAGEVSTAQEAIALARRAQDPAARR